MSFPQNTPNPNLIRSSDDLQPVPEPAPRRSPGLTYENCIIHSGDDPWAEAEACIDKAFQNRPDQDPGLALVFGLGLGYHLKVLRQRYPGIRLMALEPAPELKEVFELNSILTPKDGEPPIIAAEWADFENAVRQEVIHGPASSFIVVALEGYRALRPEIFEAFENFTRHEITRRVVIDRTREATSAAFLDNLAENAGLLPDLPDLMILKGRLPARPAFIVGSGPSLDQNIEYLKAVGNKGLILASSSALKPLLAKGIRPDIVLVLESTDTSDYLQLNEEEAATLGSGVILALASSCHPAHFGVQGFNKAIFHLTTGEAQTFSQGAFLPQGGNSGTAAFALAYVLGLGPLILVAQDQAYGQGRLHAQGTPGEVTESDANAITVDGVGGTTVGTNTGLLASLGWYIAAAQTISAQASPPALFNASAGGAKIPGFTEVPLATITASLAPVASRLDLAAVLPKLPRTSREEMQKDVAQIAGVINTMRRLAAMDYHKAYEEIKNVGEVSAFLAQILAEAKVATTKEELVAALNKADGLMTVMQISLSDRH